jgi:methylmalonyl-CoA mutase N-terminal domain/subunit
VEAGERIVVGVNRYMQDGEVPPPLHATDPGLERGQIERVRAVRARRDGAAAEAALTRLKEDAAVSGRNLMGPIIDAAKADVTMGEMCDAFREVWGTWRETPVF